jgi:hypothetical protein
MPRISGERPLPNDFIHRLLELGNLFVCLPELFRVRRRILRFPGGQQSSTTVSMAPFGGGDGDIIGDVVACFI